VQPPRILVAHPDAAIAVSLARVLQGDGYDARSVTTIDAAIIHCRAARRMDLVVLDLGLPRADPVALVERLRAARARAIILLTDRGDVVSRAEALDGGADDYIVKPFSITELGARARVVLRCAVGRPTVDAGDVHVDLAARGVSVDGELVALTRKEMDLLVALGRAQGAVVSRQRLLVEVWGTDWPGGSQTISVHVSTLRRKLGRPKAVQTARGGYRLAPPDRAP
jgi:DNA-binding response OmpR family regulator